MSTQKRRILVTSALPYANGAIHLGHMLEYIQTDIWARFQRAQGHECYFAWADDAHGTPIMLRAQSENITPDELINRMNAEHQQDFRDFGLSFDNYSTTHGDANRQCVETIYNRLVEGGHSVAHRSEALDRPLVRTHPECIGILLIEPGELAELFDHGDQIVFCGHGAAV